MGSILDFLAPVSMVITAVMLLVLNVMDAKREKEEKRMKAVREKHEEIKRRWEEAGKKEI